MKTIDELEQILKDFEVPYDKRSHLLEIWTSPKKKEIDNEFNAYHDLWAGDVTNIDKVAIENDMKPRTLHRRISMLGTYSENGEIKKGGKIRALKVVEKFGFDYELDNNLSLKQIFFQNKKIKETNKNLSIKDENNQKENAQIINQLKLSEQETKELEKVNQRSAEISHDKDLRIKQLTERIEKLVIALKKIFWILLVTVIVFIISYSLMFIINDL
jgi:hypothetical protein